MGVEKGVLLTDQACIFSKYEKLSFIFKVEQKKYLSLNCSSFFFFFFLVNGSVFLPWPSWTNITVQILFQQTKSDSEDSVRSDSLDSIAIGAVLVPRVCILFSVDLHTCKNYFFASYKHALSPKELGIYEVVAMNYSMLGQ